MSPRPLLMLIASLLLANWSPARHGEAAGPVDVKANYTKYEYRIPMRDGKRLFTSVYVPKDAVERRTRSCSRATPYSCKPYGVGSVPGQTGPVGSTSARAATSSCIRTCAGDGCRKGSSSTCGRTCRTRAGRATSTRAATRSTPSSGSIKNMPHNNGKRRPVGRLVSRLLHVVRHDRRPSGTEGRRRPRPPSATGSSATTGITTGPCS